MKKECIDELNEMHTEIEIRRKAIQREWLKTHKMPSRGRLAPEEQKELDKEEYCRYCEIMAKYKDK